MKCCDIHNNLVNQQVRDMLGEMWVKTGMGGTQHEIDIYQKQVEEAQERLKRAKTAMAARMLIENNHWAIHDISDIVEDYSVKNEIVFVGTQQEYDQFKQQNNVDK